jgi:hypothetical protein
VNQRLAPVGFDDAGGTWQLLGTVRPLGSTLTVRLTGNADAAVVADAVRLQAVHDFGADDNLHEQPDSPAIDRGDPTTYFLSEPVPNGNRVNAGAFGNTAEATASAAQVVHVSGPNGLEKLEVGQQVPIRWSTAGLLANQAIALINSGGSTVDDWSADRYRAAGIARTISGDVITSAVDDLKVPAAVYDTYADATFVDRITYNLPVPNGTYLIRLYFVEPTFGSGGRRFDVRLQGELARGDVDIAALAGGPLRAIALDFSVAAAGNQGIVVELVNRQNIAVISAIELLAADPLGIANPTFDVELSLNSGATWTTLSAGVELNRYGRGEYDWTPDSETAGNTALIRVRSRQAINLASDASDEPFLITNNGMTYFVNDLNSTGDVFSCGAGFQPALIPATLEACSTSIVGNNAASGKSADQPLASLAALLNAYDLDAGDTVFVDAGIYVLPRNLRIAEQDSGVRIDGPEAFSTAAGVGIALLNRGNTSVSGFVVEMAGADDVTLDGLRFTGGAVGIHAASNSDSDRLTVKNAMVFQNSTTGVQLEASNDFARITNNIVFGMPGGPAFDDQFTGIVMNGTDGVIENSTVFNNRRDGIIVNGARSQVRNNEVYGSGETGIIARGSDTTVRENRVHDNGSVGISASSGVFGVLNVFVEGNTVWGQTMNPPFSGYGISLGGATATGNIVFGNNLGIEIGQALVEHNRVFNNQTAGLIGHQSSGTARHNVVYSNPIGIFADGNNTGGSAFTGTIENNLVYDSTNVGILIDTVFGSQISNNTVYASRGDAVRVQEDSQNVNLRNNVLVAERGYVISMSDDSQVGFTSDYNILYATGAARLGLWQGREFNDRHAWFYELGLDQHSAVADPRFVDHNGTDNLFGVTRDPSDSARMIDDGDAVGFVLAGGWSTGSGGVGGDFRDSGSPNFSDTASWTFSGLEPDKFYQIAVTWPASATAATNAPFAVLDGSRTLQTITLNQQLAPDHFTDAGTTWHILGNFRTTGTSLNVLLRGNSNGPVLADAVRVQRLGDFGADDNLHELPASPAIDRGDPSAHFLAEPTANGGRANAGAFGNTASATPSADQTVQLLAPVGLAKIESGQPFTIRWSTAGLLASQPVALLNSGGAAVENWSADRYQSGGFAKSITPTVDRTALGDDAAPQAIYQSYYANFFRDGIHYTLPVPKGDYTVRLHFVEPFSVAGNRRFDIQIQGELVQGGYDIAAAAGGLNRATMLSFETKAGEHGGITLDLINRTSTAIISGIELLAANHLGIANPTFEVQFSPDDGASWSTLARGIKVDRYGLGEFDWTPDRETAAGRVRVVASAGIAGTPDEPFLVANGGTNYFVNDGSTIGDVYSCGAGFTPTPGTLQSCTTSFIGDNRNSGKSADQPMATLAALLDAYDLDPGDTIYVDSGTYELLRNILLRPDDSGLRIVGASDTATILDRRIVEAGSRGFDLAGADDVTLEQISMTGGVYGVFAAQNAGSDGFTLRNAQISGINAVGGQAAAAVYLQAGNNRATITDNRVHDIAGILARGGIFIDGEDGTVRDNEVFALATGISVSGARGLIERNDVFGTTSGISLSSSATGANRVRVVGNTVHDNASVGIDVGSGQSGLISVLVADNVIFGQAGMNDIGLRLAGAEATRNTVYGNYRGVDASNSSIVSQSRVFGNAEVGIELRESAASALGNQVYSNSIGITGAGFNGFSGQIENNLVYANTNHAIRISNGRNGAILINNTIYQTVGDAVRIEDNSQNLRLVNNLLWVESGHDIFVATNSQTGFVSDRNLLHQGADSNAHVGFWGGSIRDTLADWQAANAQDANSVAADPLFVDTGGADNIVGFSSAGAGFDGGLDDNFHLRRLSPAIDRGDSWTAPTNDREGLTRADDPGSSNQGNPDYAEMMLLSSQFAATGTAQNFRQNNTFFNLNLPFNFPFYDQSYGSASVSTEGFLQFGGSTNASDNTNSTGELLAARRVAPLWDNIRTTGTGDDIFVDTSTGGQITIRWNATNEADSSDVNFSITLVNDGRIQFHYGPGNTNLTPTIGISRGNGREQLLSINDAQFALTGANTVEFALTSGLTFVDLGAHEFQASSLDTTPPAVLQSVLHAHEGIGQPFSEIHVTFSEPLDPTDARSPANYDFREAGANGILGDTDDTSFLLQPSYVSGSRQVTLRIVVSGGILPAGNYRFKLSGNSTLHDLAGLALDGDGDSVEGGDSVTVNQSPILAAIGNRSIDETVTLAFAVTATDPDGQAGGLTFGLDDGAPLNAMIDPITGFFSWTPTEDQGPSNYTITVRVTDSGSPSLSDSETVQITVREIDRPPLLDPIGDRNVPEGGTVSFTAVASETDEPFQPRSFRLDPGAPAGAMIDPITGKFTWATDEFNGPGEYHVTVRVLQDSDASLNDFETFTIRVDEVNTPPVLAKIGNRTINEGRALSFFATATDPDAPSNTLTFSLDPGAPAGATIDPTDGFFTWTPTEDQGPVTYTVTVRVTDNGFASLEDFETLTIRVREVNRNPMLQKTAPQSVRAGEPLLFSVAATDADLPVNKLSFRLEAGAPEGAAIDSMTGLFTWTPPLNQASGVYPVTVRITDDGSPPLNRLQAVNITVQATAGNTAPASNPGGPYSVVEGNAVQLDGRSSSDAEQPFSTLIDVWDLDGDGLFGETGPAAERGDETGPQPVFSSAGLDGPLSVVVQLRVTDDGNLSHTAAATISVTNAAPAIRDLTSDAAEIGLATEGQSAHLTARLFDSAAADILAITIDWGDGTVNSIAAAPTSLVADHIYLTGGAYTITAVVRDDDGGSATQTTEAFATGAGIHNRALQLIGTGRSDELQVSATKRTIRVKGSFLGSRERVFDAAAIDRIFVLLGAGNDRATVSRRLRIPLRLDGGAGDDRLTGGGGPNVVIGNDGNDKIRGGRKNDILVGGAGDDRLNDSAGRNLLLGSAGTDRITSGRDQDVIVTGSTTHDPVDEALRALLDEWASTRDRTTRVANLHGNGTGPRANGNFFLQPGTTVLDDQAADTLLGKVAEDLIFSNSQDKLPRSNRHRRASG